MANSSQRQHPYYLVDPSPWPLLASFAAGLLAVGLVLWMHEMTSVVKWLGLAAVLGTMYGWWRDVVREARAEKGYNPVVQLGLRYGVILFIVSEVMFFVAFFWAYFDNSLFPKGGIWPPKGIETFDPFDLPFLNTLLLLLSGTTVTWAHHALLHKDRDGVIQGLLATVALGVVFLFLQAYEYSIAPFGLKDGIYPSVFFLATGFHGFHVLVGTIFLAVCLFRAQKGDFDSEHHVGFEAAAWYWHFVDVVWLFLFVSVYIFGSA
jgi:cytochrome c oxidase subunit III